MTKVRLLVALLVLAVVAPVTGPLAAAEDPRAQRERTRNRKAQLARELDGLTASENKLVAAVAALDAQVSAQAAQVEAARQAVAAAEAEAAEAESRRVEMAGHMANLTNRLVDRAVQSFMKPDGDGIDEMVQSTDIAEAARKRALLGQVAANDVDVIDQLNAAREEFELARQAAEAARAKADARRQETQARLAELEAARSEKQRLKAALDTRQAEVLSEVRALAAADQRLTEIIRRADAAAAAERARRTSTVSASPDGRVGSGGCIWPARGTVTSEYGYRWGRLHAGIDIAASTGTPIWSAKAGVVIFAGRQSGYGNVVMVSHGEMTTVYAHQSRIASSEGQRVSQGQVIGYVGNTGRSTGPHLHFETRYGGSPRNPRHCLP